MNMKDVSELIMKSSASLVTARYFLGSYVEYAEITWRDDRDNEKVIDFAESRAHCFRHKAYQAGTGEVVLAWVIRDGRMIYLDNESYAEEEKLKSCANTL